MSEKGKVLQEGQEDKNKDKLKRQKERRERERRRDGGKERGILLLAW